METVCSHGDAYVKDVIRKEIEADGTRVSTLKEEKVKICTAILSRLRESFRRIGV